MGKTYPVDSKQIEAVSQTPVVQMLAALAGPAVLPPPHVASTPVHGKERTASSCGVVTGVNSFTFLPPHIPSLPQYL